MTNTVQRADPKMDKSCTSNVKIESLLFSESSHTPDYEIWNSLDAYQLTEEHCQEIEMVPRNKYFEIPSSSSNFGSVGMLFDQIRPEGDKPH